MGPQQHNYNTRLSILCIIRDIDEIVLTYVISILEDLVEESDPNQTFDSDSFMEMIVAYLPQLEGVDVSSHLIDFTRAFFI